jgi:hypothetical protein
MSKRRRAADPRAQEFTDTWTRRILGLVLYGLLEREKALSAEWRRVTAEEMAACMYASVIDPGHQPAGDYEMFDKLGHATEMAIEIDELSYVPASQCLDTTRVTTIKKLHAALRANPWVRTHKPSPQRLEVHAGDWHRYIAKLDAAAFDNPNVDAFLAEARREEIKRRKAGGQ